MTDLIRVVALVGPTAVGKTELSFTLAERVDAEIVSLDSMQAYRGMDIGTAKPTAEELARVHHHMIDVSDPTGDVTVARFRDLAREAIADIASRGRLPLLVGGSGLYFRAVVDDLKFPPRSATVRTRLEAEADAEGPVALHERLTAVDPVAAGRIEVGNVRRTVRALEAIEITGALFSEFDSSWDRYESIYDLRAIGLSRERPVLYERIGARVDAMLAAGLVEEVERLARAGLSRNASQALGYRQVLEMPEASAGELRDEIVRATKRFARRQEAWFRADPRITWLDGGRPDLPGAAEAAGGF
ncbi:MAG: tRNA (adenosine(37)-N6)-dimethylallyltransferase MiaA [Actinobacteria bacterium]|nr:tRNA (adenosine(37)-N6)-dimethylallyltransferase MiaA [Actinomycetota bacterium]